MKGMYCLLSFAFLALNLSAQESAKEVMLKKQKAYNDRTMVQRFEKKMIPTAADRIRIRQENEEKRKSLLVMIDTSTVIKDKLRARLKHDVMHDPFSSRLQKFVALYKVEKMPMAIAQNEK
ncbi:hypothetical protein [Croceitalea rosinachiae]|uniref:LTXXQ motif family protein n=1 Tax=Croceitalea rosinachiae TaxID=3075596 RepID=A0ABU3ABR5_9FLAO|nr:hypothetical protein [Croceitalea sp. F388]MDT0607627.1 hypothetical protein [Croceitalea sp. F388]